MLKVTPAQAYFQPGQPVTLTLTLTEAAPIDVTLYHLVEKIGTWVVPARGSRTEFTVQVPSTPRCGYLVQATAAGQTAFTAFDVLERWTDAPRYGYVYDFKPNRTSDSVRETLDYLLALHINGLQFYDWQYRHDTLLPETETFIDPLGRPLSLSTVRQFIEGAHARGMAAMPYTAIYAASPAFTAAHPEWALYDAQGQIVDFADGFLKLMAPQGAWQAHFVQECVRVLAALPFDGIHVDQYGEPRTGFNAQGHAVDLPQGFADTLNAIREAIGPKKVLLFNLVHNWPVAKLASVPLDFWYSELWPPDVNLNNLSGAIRLNRSLNPRPAVIAAYIPSAWEQTVYAAHCRILAAGGTHIAHGDHQTYLSDPYFPKAEHPSQALMDHLRAAADFAVAYEEVLVFGQDVTDQYTESVYFADEQAQPGEIIIHQYGSCLYLNLLRSRGNWTHELHTARAATSLITLRDKLQRDHLQGAWCASPEAPLPVSLPVTDVLSLPAYPEWLLVCLQFEGL